MAGTTKFSGPSTLASSEILALSAGGGEDVTIDAPGASVTVTTDNVNLTALAVELSGQLSSAPSSQAFSATPTFNFNLSNHHTMGACTANVTAVTISNARSGAIYTIKMLQDAGGVRTAAGWDSDLIFGSVATNVLGLGANIVTVWTFIAESATQIRCIARDVYAS